MEAIKSLETGLRIPTIAGFSCSKSQANFDLIPAQQRSIGLQSEE